MKLLILSLMLLSVSCVTKLKYVETPLSAVERYVIEGFCTGYAVYTPEYGLIFKVRDIRCQDYDATIGEFLTKTLPGRLIIEEGDQYIQIDPLVFQDFLESIGDTGLIQFSKPETE